MWFRRTVSVHKDLIFCVCRTVSQQFPRSLDWCPNSKHHYIYMNVLIQLNACFILLIRLYIANVFISHKHPCIPITDRPNSSQRLCKFLIKVNEQTYNNSSLWPVRILHLSALTPPTDSCSAWPTEQHLGI